LVERADLKLVDRIRVPARSIDDYAVENGLMPDVVRMDIEGGEIFALRGACQTMRRTRLLFLELHCCFLSDSDLAEIVDILSVSGLKKIIWFDRYYDWPWSNPAAARRSLEEGGIDAFSKALVKSRNSVISVFAGRV